MRCREIYHEVDEKLRVTESNLCAFSSRGDSCEGDSGGGLVMQSPENRQALQYLKLCLILLLLRHYEIVGVVSYGVGCNSTFKGENPSLQPRHQYKHNLLYTIDVSPCNPVLNNENNIKTRRWSSDCNSP